MTAGSTKPIPSPESGPASGPAVDVRIVLFTIAGSRLHVALQSTSGELPRGLPEDGIPLDETAHRIARDVAHLPEQYLEQLYTLSVPQAAGGWSVIVSYLALLSSGATPPAVDAVGWHPMPLEVEVSRSDAMVIDYALTRLRAKLTYTNIAFYLLPESFTLTELQVAYETILDRHLDKRNFRRRIIASGTLVETQEKRREGSHRPAALYRFSAAHDPATYLTPDWALGAESTRT